MNILRIKKRKSRIETLERQIDGGGIQYVHGVGLVKKRATRYISQRKNASERKRK